MLRLARDERREARRQEERAAQRRSDAREQAEGLLARSFRSVNGRRRVWVSGSVVADPRSQRAAMWGREIGLGRITREEMVAGGMGAYTDPVPGLQVDGVEGGVKGVAPARAPRNRAREEEEERRHNIQQMTNYDVFYRGGGLAAGLGF